MYVTAHRVRSRKGAEGINSFLHEHAGDDGVGLNWGAPDIAAISERLVGKLVADSYDVPPGGNRVLSYLEAAAPDGTSVKALREALRALRRKVDSKREYPALVRTGSIVCRCWVGQEHLDGADQEFDRLSERILTLLGSPRREACAAGEPLQVLFSLDEKGYHFELSQESSKRVREAHRHKRWQRRRIHVPPDVMLDFESVHGDIYPHVATMLTGLRVEDVIRLGGVVFILQSTGREVRRWPS